MSIRAAFEVKFPVPIGIVWNPGSHQYDRQLRSKCTAARYAAFCETWAAWKAGMEYLADRSDQRAALKAAS